MPELQPKMRDALLAAYQTPSHSLRRACGGFIATGAPIRTSGPTLYQAFTRRTVNRLDEAGLVTFDEPEFPNRITLTTEGERLAAELAAESTTPCPQRGCTLTDGKPCAFAECPNRANSRRDA